MNQFSRSELIFGKEGISRLLASHVAIFGIGGVGGFVVEALARSGIGEFDLIDGDKVTLTNLNRQLVATHKTLGQYKVEVAKERIKEINPNAKVTSHAVFFSDKNKDDFDFKKYDYVIDAIDDIEGKAFIAEKATEAGTKIISCMGAGNKVNAFCFEVSDIYKTSVCPLAKAMRKILKERGIERLKVVYSREKPVKTYKNDEGKLTVGSTSFVPGAAGLIIAGEVIKELSLFNQENLKS